jgi:hypothetical protein
MIRLPPHVETVVSILRRQQGDDRTVGDRLADVDWESTLAFANEELVTPELYAAIDSAGLGDRLPPDVGAYLKYLHDLNRIRNERMRQQLIEVIKVWNDAGLVPIVLKGGLDLLNKAEAMTFRMVMDLDLLFDPAEIDTAVRAAEVLGYRPVERDPGPHAFTYLARSAGPAFLDLHRGLLCFSHLLPVEGLRRRAIPVQRDGVRTLVPSGEDQLMHRVLHDMVHSAGHRNGTISLRGLTDFTRIVKANSTLDWAAIFSDLKRHSAHNVLRAQAYAARELLGVEVPQTIAGGPAARLYCWRGVARWRRHGTDIEPLLLRLFLSGLAYRWDPAARMMPFSVKLVRRLLYGSEPTPVGPPSGSASACASRSRRGVLAKPASHRR